MIEIKFTDAKTAKSPKSTLLFLHSELGGLHHASVIYGEPPAHTSMSGEGEAKTVKLLFHSEQGVSEKEARGKINDWVNKVVGEFYDIDPMKSFDRRD